MSSNVIPINSEYTEESKWISAPLYQQAFRWFREKHNLHGIVSYCGKNQWDIELLDYKGNQLVEIENNIFWTYEEAELACLNKLIEITKTKQYDKRDNNY